MYFYHNRIFIIFILKNIQKYVKIFLIFNLVKNY